MELFKPEFGLVFWMFFVFVVLFAILAKYAWPFIIRNIDERAEFIDKGVAYSQEAKMQLVMQLKMPKPFWLMRINSKWKFLEKLLK